MLPHMAVKEAEGQSSPLDFLGPRLSRVTDCGFHHVTGALSSLCWLVAASQGVCVRISPPPRHLSTYSRPGPQELLLPGGKAR